MSFDESKMVLIKNDRPERDEHESLVDLIRSGLSSETLDNLNELAFDLAESGDLEAAAIVEDLAGISGQYTGQEVPEESLSWQDRFNDAQHNFKELCKLALIVRNQILGLATEVEQTSDLSPETIATLNQMQAEMDAGHIRVQDALDSVNNEESPATK